jgi:arylsulfatase A-like enzyme
MSPDKQNNLKPTTSAEHILPNVVLLTLDAFNYRLLMENLERLPHFKQLRNRSVCFENAFSVGPSTPFAFPGIIAGVYPYHFGAGINKHVEPIYSVLRNHGYRTAFINEANALLSPFFDYDRDMDHQEHFLNLSHDNVDREMAGLYLKKGEYKTGKGYFKISFKILDRIRFKNNMLAKKARSLFYIYRFVKLCLTHNTNSLAQRSKLYHEFRGEILRFINNEFQSPQFLWMHTIINHLPYFPVDSAFSEGEINRLNYRGLARLVNRKNGERLKLLYIDSMKRTDDLLGAIIGALENKNFFCNTLLAVTADHGEEFMEEGYLGHEDGSSSDRLLHVPLMFCWPNKLAPKNITMPVSTMDIAATISDLLGLKAPETNRGISQKAALFGTQDDITDPAKWQRPIFSEAWERGGLLDKKPGQESQRKTFTVRRGRYKLKLIQSRSVKGTIKEEAELRDWIEDKDLNRENEILIYQGLRQMLEKHISEEGDFATAINNKAEKRRIKNIAVKLNKL